MTARDLLRHDQQRPRLAGHSKYWLKSKYQQNSKHQQAPASTQ